MACNQIDYNSEQKLNAVIRELGGEKPALEHHTFTPVTTMGGTDGAQSDKTHETCFGSVSSMAEQIT